MSRVHWRVFAAVLLWGLGDGLWLFLLPLYVAQLGAEPAQIGWVLATGLLGAALGFIPAGIWADRHARKPVFVGGYGLAIVAVLGMAVAPTWQWLLPALVLYNLTVLSRPALHSYLTSHCTDPDHAGRCFGRTFSGYPLGALLTPVLGGYLGQQWDLRLVFALAVAFYLVSVLLLARLPGERPAGTESVRWRRFRWGDGLSLMIFLFALFLALYLGQPLAVNYLQEARGLELELLGLMGSAAALGTVVLNWLLGLLPETRPWALFASLLAVFAGLVLLLTAPTLVLLLVGCFLLSGANTAAVISSGFLRRQTSTTQLGVAFGQRDMTLYLAMAASNWLAGQLYQRDPALPLQVALLVLAVMGVILLALCRRSYEWPAASHVKPAAAR